MPTAVSDAFQFCFPAMQVLRSCPAAVDGDDLSGDERRPVRRRELDGVGDFLRPAHTLERNAGDQAGLASAFPVKRFSISVSTGPGATALTRTPNAAPSSAADLVRPSTACLLAV